MISKRIYVTIFMLCLLLILGACSSAPAESEKGPPSLDKYLSADDKAESAAESRKEEEAKKEANKSPISDDIRSYEILINGELLKFPMTQEELSKTSWKYIGETPLSEIEAQPGIKVEALYSNGKANMIFNLINTEKEAAAASEAVVAGLHIKFNEENNLTREEVILPKNVSPDYCDLNSLKSVYGEPSEVYHDGSGNTPKSSKLIYRKDGGLHSTTLFANNEEKNLIEIIILSHD